LEECRHAEAEALLRMGDSKCFSKKCFNVCGTGALGEPEVCTVNMISALFKCSLVHIEAKCCGKVSQPNYLTEVGHSIPFFVRTCPYFDSTTFFDVAPCTYKLCICFVLHRLGQPYSHQSCPSSIQPLIVGIMCISNEKHSRHPEKCKLDVCRIRTWHIDYITYEGLAWHHL
jgi:hypothetical protein